jgi:nucleoside-diphosphate-sugar epimerase
MARAIGCDIAPQYREARTGDVRHSLASIERARDLIGYEPRVDWREGLARTLAWYRERLANTV